MQLLHTRLLGLTAIAAALALAGCGGGGSSPNPDNDGPFTVDGVIERTDFPDGNDDRYYDIYQLDVTRTGTAEIELASRDFDAQIFVYRRNSDGRYGNVIAQNDDIDGDTSDARVRFTVKRGETYRVTATSARAREFGDYRIFFSRELGRPAVVLPRENGRTAPGFDLPAITPKAAKATP